MPPVFCKRLNQLDLPGDNIFGCVVTPLRLYRRRYFRPGAAGAILLLLLACLTSCSQEKLISAADLLPPEATEVAAPDDLVRILNHSATAGQFWVRACRYSGGWPELVRYMDAQAQAQGYVAIELPDAEMDADLKLLGLQRDDYMRAYHSPRGSMLVQAFNLNVRRQAGVPVEGLADYVLLGGTSAAPRHKVTRHWKSELKPH